MEVKIPHIHCLFFTASLFASEATMDSLSASPNNPRKRGQLLRRHLPYDANICSFWWSQTPLEEVTQSL